MRLSLPQNHATPHLARLRSRRDIGTGGLTFFCAVFATVVLTSVARAAPVQEVTVREASDLTVKVRIVGAKAPTFQVFRLPGRDAFAIELPGADMSGVRADLAGGADFLESARLEKSGTPRVVVQFHGDVDYDADTTGSTLEVVFSPLGDKAALKKAAADRRASSSQRSSADAELKRTTARLNSLKAEEDKLAARVAAERREKEKALAALDEQAANKRAQLKNLEKRRADEDARIAALRKKTEDEQKAFDAAKARTAKAEQGRATVEKQIASAKQELARVRDEVRLAREKSELKKVQDARAAEEKRLAAAQSTLARTQKDTAAVEQRAKAAAAKIRELSARADAEEKRTAQMTERRKSAEVQVATLVDRQTREQDHLREIMQRMENAKAKLAALETDVRERSSRLAAIDQKLRAKSQRLQNLDGRVKQAEARLGRAQQQVAMAQTQRQPAGRAPQVAPARAPKPAPRGRISVASAKRDGYGFGGRSIDLDPRNRYRRADKGGYDLDEPGRGQLSHITVRRSEAGASQVGVRVDGGASYSLARTGDNELVLTLYDTRAANLDVRRILDARDLGSSVLRVLPRVREGSTNRVELTIELRDDAPVRVGSDESMLWLHVGQG